MRVAGRAVIFLPVLTFAGTDSIDIPALLYVT